MNNKREAQDLENASAQPAIQETNAPSLRDRLKAPQVIEEQRLIRRMQMMMNLVLQTIAQDNTLSVDDASQMIADARNAALTMFPGKELAYDLIWKPRFQRMMRERFPIN